MPIYYAQDLDYKTTDEEVQDMREATLAKLESLGNENIMDFDEFLAKEGICDALFGKNYK